MKKIISLLLAAILTLSIATTVMAEGERRIQINYSENKLKVEGTSTVYLDVPDMSYIINVPAETIQIVDPLSAQDLPADAEATDGYKNQNIGFFGVKSVDEKISKIYLKVTIPQPLTNEDGDTISTKYLTYGGETETQFEKPGIKRTLTFDRAAGTMDDIIYNVAVSVDRASFKTAKPGHYTAPINYLFYTDLTPTDLIPTD